ncbi:MAG: tetratricopeptide repeat protein [Verrucomicrobiales bacterium]|nr:tetratricopeptide repeat protein [Verrucomicrobiales bacterium]
MGTNSFRRKWIDGKWGSLVCAGILFAAFGVDAANRLSPLEQIPIESFREMREVERYQLKVAEKHYLEGEYKIALDEYEKFLSLYESSSAAAYSQLMWSHCLLRLRKVNTAIREGFQSVIDYWPDSQEAKTASYLIARSYQDMGEVEKARVAFQKMIESVDDVELQVRARNQILEMAKTKQDWDEVLRILGELTFDTERIKGVEEICRAASRDLGSRLLRRGDWDGGIEALETSYEGGGLDEKLFEYGRSAVGHLRSQDETRAAGDQMLAKLLARFEATIPDDLTEEGNQSRARTALNRIAELHGAAGRKTDVLATYERIEKMLGVSDGLLGQIASFYRGIGEREKARATYRRYENQVAAKSAIAGMYREESKFDEAIELYRELIEEDPDRVNDYLWVIGDCFERKGAWKEAIQTYRQIDKFPDNYLRMARCHRRLKQWDEALSLYSQSKSSEPHAPGATLSIGYTYEEAGQRENAIKAFQLTCRSYPKSSEASRAHAHLQSKYQITATFGGGKDE